LGVADAASSAALKTQGKARLSGPTTLTGQSTSRAGRTSRGAASGPVSAGTSQATKGSISLSSSSLVLATIQSRTVRAELNTAALIDFQQCDHIPGSEDDRPCQQPDAKLPIHEPQLCRRARTPSRKVPLWADDLPEQQSGHHGSVGDNDNAALGQLAVVASDPVISLQ
jgi:hypothetical protein